MTKKLEFPIESLLGTVENGIDFEEKVFIDGLKERKIILNDEITDSLVERLMIQILKWNEEDEGKPIELRKEIRLYINSPGGIVTTGIVGASIIETSKTPIHGIVLGGAYSMGALLFLSCHKRTMYETSSLLLHSGNVGVYNSSKKAKNTMDFYDRLDDKVRELILRNSTIKPELLKDKFEGDDEWYLLANECLELGLVDTVICHDKVLVRDDKKKEGKGKGIKNEDE